ncbi:protein sey1 [Anaeramoeba flamelloides]|uniref:Protein sey1 n=1 Tax=Anaeramoeba flamelloides TaxID=1746091 RepID=A0ABQ8Y4X4_9EUKA|nr:protein sey1 [Anaeramoeba flamelloides]
MNQIKPKKREQLISQNTNNDRVFQLITEEGEFNSNNLEQISKWNVFSKGLNYGIVGIIGCCGSGKSTLLNLIFGTNLKTDKPNIHSSRTTKGIWIAESEDHSKLIIDVEGNDSDFRANEQENFSMKTSLFTLALSDLLIINLWEHDIGRYRASNYHLLKNVLEVSLKIFNYENHKTSIIFAVRDYSGRIKFSMLNNKINENINKIWNEIDKPKRFENKKFKDLFDSIALQFHHKAVKPKAFLRGVNKIKKYFINQNNPKYFFKKKYHKGVPGDGLLHFIQNIWKKVSENKEIDIPSEKKMLSLFRCEVFKTETWEFFLTNLQSEIVEPLNNNTVIDQLKETMQGLIEDSIQFYNLKSRGYDKQIAQNKIDEIVFKFYDQLHSPFEKQIELLSKATFKKFIEQLDKYFPTKLLSASYQKHSKNIFNNFSNEFSQKAKDSILPNMDWQYQVEFDKLQKMMNTEIEIRRSEGIKCVSEIFFNELSNRIIPTIKPLFKNINTDFQTKLFNNYIKNFKKCFNYILETLKGYGSNELYIKHIYQQLSKEIENIYLQECRNTHKKILNLIISHFNTYLKENRPKKNQEYNDFFFHDIYEKAKASGLKLLERFRMITIPLDLYPEYEKPENQNINNNFELDLELEDENQKEIEVFEAEYNSTKEVYIINEKDYQSYYQTYVQEINILFEEFTIKYRIKERELFLPNLVWVLIFFFARNDLLKLLENIVLAIIIFFVVFFIFLFWKLGHIQKIFNKLSPNVQKKISLIWRSGPTLSILRYKEEKGELYFLESSNNK